VLGLLYDVHGNLPALEAVLDDASDVDRWLLGGDYTLFGAWPEGTLTRLRELDDATWIRGNGERWAADPADAPEPVRAAISWCAGMLGRDAVAEMAALPESHRDGGTLFCHGSPGSDVRSFLPEAASDEEELLEDVQADLLVFGHTHLAFARESAQGIALANPGSVGMPFDGDPRAAYAVLHDDGRIEHRRVAYDHAASAAAVRAALGPAGEVPAARIERATAQVG
jgi:diadenosine tetraphosphatase ApaH/serine/threonine PP2A family protein phosphatase